MAAKYGEFGQYGRSQRVLAFKQEVDDVCS